MIKFFKRLIYFFVLLLCSHIAITSIDGIKYDTLSEEASFVIVLGSKVNEDGTLSKRLKARLDKSIELYNKNNKLSFFVSGGFGKEGFPEGTKMKDYLVTQGVPTDAIFVDNKGNNTRLTAQNFKSQFPTGESVCVVSQFFHVSRCKLALKQVGVKEVNGFSPGYYEWRDIYVTLREILAYYKYLLLY